MCFIYRFVNECVELKENWIGFVIVCKLWMEFDGRKSMQWIHQFRHLISSSTCVLVCLLLIFFLFPNRRVRNIRMFIVQLTSRTKMLFLMQKAIHEFVDVCVWFSPTKHIHNICNTFKKDIYIGCYQHTTINLPSLWALSHQFHSYVNSILMEATLTL